MGTVLIDQWLGGAESTPTLDEASVVLLRQRVHAEGASLGFTEAGLGSIVNVASELAHNQLAHARGGRMAVRTIERDGIRGIEIIAVDRGPGIASPTEALKGRQPAQDPQASAPGRSLGIGLAASLELADELDFDVRMGEGSCIWARKFTAPVSRRRKVGIFGRPYPGEDESGDDGGFARSDEGLLVAVADGLGHGTLAREASAAALDILRKNSDEALDRIVASCHEGLRDTRGAVLAIARIGEPELVLRGAALGDVSMLVAGPGTNRRMMGRSLMVGARGQTPKVVVEEIPIGARDVVLSFTDGISSRADFSADLDLLREHPIVIAHQIVERFARDTDDALVLVVA